MTKKILFIVTVITSSLFFTGCDPDDPEPDTPVEIITTLNFTLTPVGGGTPVTLSFVDLDGDAGNDPVITDGILNANTTYSGSIVLLNELESPAEIISEEVEEEDEEHQFFFDSTISDLTIAYNDEDEDGNPLGLSSTLTTGSASSGSISIVLRHEPDKFATGVSAGEIANAGGETDIEVTIPVNVQ
jgi:hypothetical protein